jgi:hypothetical protein
MQIMINQTQPESVEYFEYFGSTRNYGREIKSSIVVDKAAFNKKTKFDLSLRKKISKMLQLEDSLYGAETRTLRKLGEKYLASFEM